MPAHLHILHIEDDADDADLLQEAFADNGHAVTTEVLREGDKILHWLEVGNILPNAIVMDLNLPKLHGKEVLAAIKANHKFKDVPVVVLTTSSSDAERNYCLQHGAALFITKPTTFAGFKNMVELIVGVAKR